MSVAKIIILDEVNCKIEGLDLETRKKCSNALKYRLPHAFHIPSVKLGRWDGCVEFFTIGGRTYINLLEKPIQIIQDAGYEFELEDHRTKWDFKFDSVENDYLSDSAWPDDHPTHANKPITFLDHQEEVINKYLQNYQCIQRVPTAAGKTLISAALSKKAEKYGRSIVIVPSQQLVEQTYEDYKMIGLDSGMYYGNHKDIGKTHTICTWQSLDRMMKGEADIEFDEFLKGVICVIGDEIHGAKAAELQKILSGPFKNVPLRWGMTGTMPKEKHDLACLLGTMGELIYEIKAIDLQDAGVLSNCHIHIVQTMDKKEFNGYPDELEWLVQNDDRLHFMSAFVEQIAATGNTLVLVSRKATGFYMEKAIPDSVFIHGQMKVKDRKKEYKEVATVNNKIIVATYGVASVGINVPRVFNVVIVEPGKAFIRCIQTIGRGLRRAEDKDFVQIWDICSYTKYSKRHLRERKKYYRDEGYPFLVTKISADYHGSNQNA